MTTLKVRLRDRDIIVETDEPIDEILDALTYTQRTGDFVRIGNGVFSVTDVIAVTELEGVTVNG